ncbi:MAG: class I SAM-dependent methyltransferase [Phenylobacterium sp.]
MSTPRYSRPFWAMRRFARLGIELARGTAWDLADSLRGRREPLTPPRRLFHLIGSPNLKFHASGQEFRDFLIQNGLEPQHRLLDVGCGLGRLAVALMGYLDNGGSYDGFDIMPPTIRWCRRITDADPRFRFKLVDLHSDRYHPGGEAQASRFVFPYRDNTFDFVVLGSVFTHLLPDDMRNYLAEIARVTKPGGRCVISWYLLTPEAREAAARGAGLYSFAHAGDGYWAEDPKLPEAAIAFDEAEIMTLYDRLGFEVGARYPGLWSGAKVGSQDVVVAQKR